MSQTQSQLIPTDENRADTTSFDDKASRSDDMADRIEDWLGQLVDATADATESDQFREWLDVQSRFHDYSFKNTLLIKMQFPGATRVAGFNTWKNEFDRYVKKGESAVWIWGPIITKRCPECENSESYHSKIGCEYDETAPGEWDRGLVGFRPVSVFDVSQTEGEPLPELETAAYGDADGLTADLLDAAEALGYAAEIVPAAEWGHGEARGVSFNSTGAIKVMGRENEADKASTLIHELAHSLLHAGATDAPELEKREVEAEATAYVVGRHFGLDVAGSAFYLAAWSGDDPEAIRERLDRISSTARDIIGTVEA